MAKIEVYSSKGSYLGYTTEVVDLVHDASVFRPRSDEAERIEPTRGYILLTGVIPTAGIVRIIDTEKKEVEDYLITYPFFGFKAGVNLLGLGRRKTLSENPEEEIDNIEYEETFDIEGNPEEIFVGSGVSGKDLKKALERLKEEKDFYPELYQKIEELGEENPAPEVLALIFSRYIDEKGVQGIKDLRSLGLNIKSKEDLTERLNLKLILDMLKEKNFQDFELENYIVQFIPTNLIQTGVMYKPETKEFSSTIVFQPQRIPLEPARSVAQYVNAQSPLYPSRQIALKVLNRKNLLKLQSGDKELKERLTETLENLEVSFPNAKEWLEKVKTLLEKEKWEELEKELRRAYVENRKIFEKAMLEKPLVDKGRILKKTSEGKYFLTNPLANRGYSLRFAKKIYDEFSEKAGEKVLLSVATPLPRLILENNELKVKMVLKPVAVIVGKYNDEENLEEFKIIRSRPQYIFEKWDRRIAGAIKKRNMKALAMLKKEITKEKSLSGIYTKLIDEAIRQIGEEEEFKGIIKDYLDTVEQTRKELPNIYATLKDEETLMKNLKKFENLKEIAEGLSYDDLGENEILKNFKAEYQATKRMAKAIERSVFVGLTENKSSKPKQKQQAKPDEIELEIPEVHSEIMEEELDGEIPLLLEDEEEEDRKYKNKPNL